jgi:hypothetical protein
MLVASSSYRIRCLAMVFTVAVAPLTRSAASTETNWLDVESRIQYGYYTEDARAIASVLEMLVAAESDSALRRYYTGLGNYRLTQLVSTADRGRAKDTAAACVENLEQALKIDAASDQKQANADALALASACLDRLAQLEAWRAPFAAAKSGSLIARARHLSPKNPRVLLLEAVEVYGRPKKSASDVDRASEGFEQAIAAFEAERRQSERAPGWGAAEAYLYLAKCRLDRGAALNARDALERALLIAPELAEARRLMAHLTTG